MSEKVWDKLPLRDISSAPAHEAAAPAIRPRSDLSLFLSRFSLSSLRATRPQSNTL